MKSATGADREETIKAIADSFRNQVVRGWTKRESINWAKPVAKGTGHDLYLAGLYEAVREGSL